MKQASQLQPSEQFHQKEQIQTHPVSQSRRIEAIQTSQLLKINGDSQNNLHVWLLRVIVAVVVITILILKLALPQTYIIINNDKLQHINNQSCNPSNIDTGRLALCNDFSSSNPKLGLFMKDLTVQNQFILYNFDITMESSVAADFYLQQQITIQAYQIAEIPKDPKNQAAGQNLFVKKRYYNVTEKYYLPVERMSKNPNDDKSYLRLFAYDRISVHSTQFKFSALFILTFSNYTQVSKATKVNIYGATVSPHFTVFTIVIRMVYCLISTISCVVYLRRFCQIKKQDRILQMYLIAVASVLLILFNDPFYSLTVLKLNPASTFFSSLFVVLLFIHMLMLWMFFLRKIFQEPEENATQMMLPRQSWPFYLLMFGLFASILALFLQYAYYAYNNIPIVVSSSLVEMNAIVTIVFVAIFLSVAAIYQIIMFIRIMKKYFCDKDAAQLPWRHLVYLIYYPYFFIIFLVFFAFGGAMPYNYEGPWILYAYSFMNIFVFILQYLYYVPSQELEKQKQNVHKKLEAVSLNNITNINQHPQMNQSGIKSDEGR